MPDWNRSTLGLHSYWDGLPENQSPRSSLQRSGRLGMRLPREGKREECRCCGAVLCRVLAVYTNQFHHQCHVNKSCVYLWSTHRYGVVVVVLGGRIVSVGWHRRGGR
jgi:hypothetical protein